MQQTNWPSGRTVTVSVEQDGGRVFEMAVEAFSYVTGNPDEVRRRFEELAAAAEEDGQPRAVLFHVAPRGAP
jgi:hypothetical protein